MKVSNAVAGLSAVLSIMLCSSVFAEGQPVQASRSVAQQSTVQLAKRWVFNLRVEDIAMDDAVARREWVEADAVAVLLEGEYFLSETVSTSVGAGYLKYDDLNEFRQLTESVYGGDVEYSSSNAAAVPLLLDVGYTRFSDGAIPLYWTARGGLTYLLASERAVEQCADCYSQDIEIDGGVFAELGVGVNLGHTVSLGLFYQNYLTGDLENALGLKISVGRFRGK